MGYQSKVKKKVNPKKKLERKFERSGRWKGVKNRIKNPYQKVTWDGNHFILMPQELRIINEVKEHILDYYAKPKKISIGFTNLQNRMMKKRKVKTITVATVTKAVILLTLMDKRFKLRCKRNKVQAHKVTKKIDFKPDQ